MTRAFLTDEDAWSARSRTVRAQRGACELCGWYGTVDLTFTLWRKPRRWLCRLETNHRYGARQRHAHGQEPDHALQVLCTYCHRRVTNRHNELAKEKGAWGPLATGGRGITQHTLYSACVEQASNEAVWRWWRIRRWLFVRLFIDPRKAES